MIPLAHASVFFQQQRLDRTTRRGDPKHGRPSLEERKRNPLVP
jgi:hypothetical protein